MKIEEFLDKLYLTAQNSAADEFQINYNYIKVQNWELQQGELSKKLDTENQKVSVKLKKDGTIGCCVSYNLTEDAIPEIIKYALENTKLIDKVEKNFFYNGKGTYAKVAPYEPISDKIDTLDPINYMKEIENHLLKADMRVQSNPRISFTKVKKKMFIKNSLGVNVCQEKKEAFCGVMVIVKDGDDIKSRFERILFDKKEDFNPSIIANRAVKKAVSHLHGIKPKSGSAKVVFAPESFSIILEYLCHCTSAAMVDKKQSQFVGKIGELVAAPIVTIKENPLKKGGYHTAAFDDEGVPTCQKEIITKGVLQTYLYSLKTAQLHGTNPTGNGEDKMFGSLLMNLYLEKGELTNKELLKKVGNGIYVDDIKGFWQAMMTNSSGDFSVSASGFLIENGEIKQSLEQFTIAGNFYQMLKDIKLIANDLTFHYWDIGTGSPTVWVDGLTIGGK